MGRVKIAPMSRPSLFKLFLFTLFLIVSATLCTKTFTIDETRQ